MPLGRRNSPGRSPLPPTLRRRSPVSASNTTSEWLDLAVATSQAWPSSVGQVARESISSPGLSAETERSGTRTVGEARLAVGAWVASGAVVVHADRHRAAAMLNRAGLDIDGVWTRRLGKVDPRNRDHHAEISIASCR